MEQAANAPSTDHMRQVMVRYAEMQTAGDVEAIVALFSDDALVRDPVNAPAMRGKDALRAFFTAGFEQTGGANDMQLEGAVRFAGNQAAAAFIVRTLRSKPVFRVETLDVMTFNDAGLITQMLAYWGPDNFSQED